jgi:hypothetical protein
MHKETKHAIVVIPSSTRMSSRAAGAGKKIRAATWAALSLCAPGMGIDLEVEVLS